MSKANPPIQPDPNNPSPLPPRPQPVPAAVKETGSSDELAACEGCGDPCAEDQLRESLDCVLLCPKCFALP